MEDSDIEPAPKLIEVLFQNCKGNVDPWVEHYLRITIERLRRTQKPYLKCLLVQVVRCNMNTPNYLTSDTKYFTLCLVLARANSLPS